jgi:hygromycin-B 7''-O-kinase
VMGLTSTLMQQALHIAEKEFGARPDASWSPSGQGAVGHILGLRTAHQSLVMKLFVADSPEEPWERELRVLNLTADYADIPAPLLVSHGRIPAPGTVPFLLMTRLPGIRWADRRQHLTDEQSVRVHRRVGSLLRQFHRRSEGETARPFGGLSSREPAWSSLADAIDDRLATLAQRYRRLGGSALTRNLERFVTRRYDALRRFGQPILCHNDFIDGNLLLSTRGELAVTGIVDFERASFGDPMADLAQTLRNAAFHQPNGARELAAAYGLDGIDPERLAVHDVLHTLEERIWLGTDQPSGWRTAVSRLDRQLEQAARSG